MRSCPFCRANATRLRIVDKWAAGDGANKRRVAYVRCLECNARGPMARGLVYDVRNERPSMGASQLLREHAIMLWNCEGFTPPPDDFKLESEVAK